MPGPEWKRTQSPSNPDAIIEESNSSNHSSASRFPGFEDRQLRSDLFKEIHELGAALGEELSGSFRRELENLKCTTLQAIKDHSRKEAPVAATSVPETNIPVPGGNNSGPVPGGNNSGPVPGENNSGPLNSTKFIHVAEVHRAASPLRPDPAPHPPSFPVLSENTDNNLPHNSTFSNPSILNSVFPHVNPSLNSLIQPDFFDGTRPWSDYRIHFGIAAAHNGWNDTVKFAQLLTRLKGEAQSIFAKIPYTDSNNYEKITRTLSKSFEDKHLTRMHHNELQARKQKVDESFTHFAKDVQRLVCLTYPGMAEVDRDSVAWFSFINGVRDPSIEYPLRSERFQTLQEAVGRATKLQSINQLMKEKQQSNNTHSNSSLKCPKGHNGGNKPFKKRGVQCYKCHKFGHYADKCGADITDTQAGSNKQQRFHPYKKNQNQQNQKNNNFSASKGSKQNNNASSNSGN
uniref:CCHC-type domain-containing protein n=1 Tax=Bracon brevicornis TaxID=1563983 RepID=A0A6V7JGY6_9HYME